MKTIVWLSFVVIFVMVTASNICANENSGADSRDTVTAPGSSFGKSGSVSGKTPGFKPQTYSHNQDMAFISLMGSRPRAGFSGYRKAVLYNAKGAVIQEIDISRSDSIYSLDKMIQEKRTKGPIIVKMIRK